MQDAVLFFVRTIYLGSELFFEVEFNRLIIPELIKFVFESSDDKC